MRRTRSTQPRLIPKSATTGAPPTVVAYTDGGCIGNPGPGGYAAILISGKHRKELSGGYRLTTNNRMELTAAIVALSALKSSCIVTLHTDSKYLAEAMSKGWPRQWKAKGWRRSKKAKALNRDLWEKLLKLCERHRVDFKWVRGHAGNRENERCDYLTMRAAKRRNLPPDKGYESNPQDSQARPLTMFD